MCCWYKCDFSGLNFTSSGANGRAVLRNSTEQEENHIKLFRRSVHDPYQACFRQFFVNNQPPAGLRKNLNTIRYICQQIAGSQDVFYATMFDENQGIAVYAGYKLDQGTINFGQAPGGTRGWKREPGRDEGTIVEKNNCSRCRILFADRKSVV